MILPIFLIIFGFCFIFYDAALIFLTPGTFLDNIFSFTHIWLALGAVFIFTAIYRIKKGHSVWLDIKRWIKICLLVLVGTGIIVSAINLYFILNPKLANISEPVDYVILLGGGIDKNGKLPKNVLNRVEATAEFMSKPEQKDSIVVVTGGTLHWLPYAEAPEIKRQLVARGIAENRILVEDQALDTIQNFQLSAKMLADYKKVSQNEILISDIAVVTNYFHLRRAERLAARMGFSSIKGIGAPCEKFKALHIYVREICAYIKLNLRILFTGKPESLVE